MRVCQFRHGSEKFNRRDVSANFTARPAGNGWKISDYSVLVEKKMLLITQVLSSEEPAGKGPLQIKPAAGSVNIQDFTGKEKTADTFAFQCLGTYFSQIDTPFRNHGLTKALGPHNRQG